MSIPLITGSDCPDTKTLAESFSIAIVERAVSPNGGLSVGYLGRVVEIDAGYEDGITLEDPFEYESALFQKKGEGNSVNIMRVVRIFTVENLTVARINVAPRVLIPLEGCPPETLDDIRRQLVSAWEGRAWIRRQASRVKGIG